MIYPLRNVVYEKVTIEGNVLDVDLINELERTGRRITMRDLNRVLMQLEIMGLVTVRWVSKDKRRIELAKR